MLKGNFLVSNKKLKIFSSIKTTIIIFRFLFLISSLLRCCSSFCSCSRSVSLFVLRHVGLMSVVVGYCMLGGFVFERLEREHEWAVKDGVAK